MLPKTAFLSIVLTIVLAKAASASFVQDQRNLSADDLSSDSANLQLVAQIDENPESIILELGLTDEQIAQLVQVDARFNPQLDELYPIWTASEGELDSLIASEDAPASEIREQYEKVESLRQQISELQFERQMAIREILRPEQRAPYAQYIEQRIANSDSE